MSPLLSPNAVRRRRRQYDKALRWALSLLQPLAPLLTCCLLAGVGAGVTAAMGQPAGGELLVDRNGSLVNASSPRRSFHPLLLAPSALSVGQSAAASLSFSSSLSSASSFASSSSSSSASTEESGQQCQLLTNDSVDKLCTDYVDRQLFKNLTSPRAARRLRFCDMFDYRKLLKFAETLKHAGDANCSALLLTGERRPNKTLCVVCLTALVMEDATARARAAGQAAVLDKYHCTAWAPSPGAAPSPSPGASTATHSFASSLLSSLTTLSPFSVSTSPSSSSSSAASSTAASATAAEGGGGGGPGSSQQEVREVDGMIDVPMNPKSHAGSSDCKDCKIAYKGWLCTVMFDQVRPFAARGDLSEAKRNLKVPACDSWCARVETECPYFTPAEEQQNGGEPLFLCREAHYHDSSRDPLSKVPCHHRHQCCYTPQDLECLAGNKTCRSLEEVCRTPSTAPDGPSANASGDDGSDTDPPPSSQQPQQQQYSPPADANGSVVTNGTSVSSSARRTSDLGVVPRLLLLLLVAYCCAAVLCRAPACLLELT